MATWQYDCVLVPRASWRNPAINPSCVLPEGSEKYWTGFPSATLEAALRTIGPPKDTWSASQQLWGQEDGTCALLTIEGGAVEELRLRVDMRTPDIALLRIFFSIARRCDLLVLTDTGEVIEPELAWFLGLAAKSRAGQFSASPQAFLASENRDEDSD